LHPITIALHEVHKGREEKTAKLKKNKEIAFEDGEPKFPCLALCHNNKKQKKNLSFFFFLLLCLLFHIKKKEKVLCCNNKKTNEKLPCLRAHKTNITTRPSSSFTS